MYQWKVFQFFNVELVKEPGTDEPNQELRKIEVNCVTSGGGHIILGDIVGTVHIVERDFKVSYAFQAYTRVVRYVNIVKQRNMLVTIGEEDEEQLMPTLKIWDLSKIESDGYPDLLRVIKLSKTHQATSLAVASNLQYIAVGLVSGTILLFSGDILRERNTGSRSVDHEPSVPITGLSFFEEPKRTILYVATTNTVSCYQITRDELKGSKLDEKGCDSGCSVITDEGEFVIGRREAVYFYNPMGFGPCMAFDADRKLLSWFRNYCISVDQAPNTPKTYTVTMYEPKNKFAAFESTFENVSHVTSEWGMVFVFTLDGKVHQLVEKDTQTKLETLFKRNLYQTAIDLATTSNYDKAAILDIYRKYGDHLEGKGDFDGAIVQYIKTIGHLEPSYVIKKFLDAQRIHNLTSYLQRLHEAGQANSNHTTLLLNCYTKLKNVKELDEFIKKPNLNFDVETAIKVCRQAQYYQHALDLALREHEHNWYLKILLEDLHQTDLALKYIEKLPLQEAADNLQKYGKVLASSLPSETTTLLMSICKNLQAENASTGSIGGSGSGGPGAASGLRRAAGKRKKTTPDDFVHIFVSQPEWLIKFLEFIIQSRSGTPLIYNTLLELYLRNEDSLRLPSSLSSPALAVANASNQDRETRAMVLLTSPEAQFDEGHALVLCQIHNFKPGILHLYEKMKLYNEILQYHMDNNENESIVAACRKYGDKDPSLWVKALAYFANKSPIDSYAREMQDVLTSIEREGLLPPLQVLQILSQSESATLGLVKDYIAANLGKEQRHIDEDNRFIRQYREDTEKALEEIKALRTGAVIFQQMKCSNCQGDLEPPAVHFLCMHSFHVNCLGDNESVCPTCAPEIRNFENLQKTLQEKANQHNEFFRQLEGSSDGFATVAKYFGRGVFNPMPATTAPQQQQQQQQHPSSHGRRATGSAEITPLADVLRAPQSQFY